MESIEKLRKLAHSIIVTGQIERTLDDIADEIEREISERYMLLPVDVDGVPIRVGDLIEYDDDGETYRLHARGVYVYHSGRFEGEKCVMNERLGIWDPSKCRHVKPRTVEDVLHDFWLEWEDHPIDIEWDELLMRLKESEAKYADEIRELMEVGEYGYRR